jgi:hypothetical protein
MYETIGDGNADPRKATGAFQIEVIPEFEKNRYILSNQTTIRYFINTWGK